MALSTTKTATLFIVALAVIVIFIVQQSDVLNMNPKMAHWLLLPEEKMLELSLPSENYTEVHLRQKAHFSSEEQKKNHEQRMSQRLIRRHRFNQKLLKIPKRMQMSQWSQFSPEKKASKWKRCEILISGKEKMSSKTNLKTDSEILHSYKPNDDCVHVLRTRFPHRAVTKAEQLLPIAFGFSIHKDARLFEQLLQAIYMPHNVYCIHIDKKSPDVFRKAILAMIRCLPNVFVSKKSADVVWGHFSIVEAQLNCMEELLQSTIKWKYYINLVGQDFPLYENSQIVVALQKLNSTNSIESFPMPGHNSDRTKKVHILQDHTIYNTLVEKSPSPHNIPIQKGSTHIVAIREFIEFLLHSKIGKDFVNFLKDTYVPDETIYSSLQQHPLTPGGLLGEQHNHITRALHWYDQNPDCKGEWVRTLCWLSIEDLQWALGETMKEKLFVHKIPFDNNDDIIECILVARQGRTYNTTAWNPENLEKKLKIIE